MTEINYNDGQWHGWNGGKCPVHPESVVEIRYLNDWDNDSQVDRIAGLLLWEHDGNIGDIVAFRVVKEYREPREFWLYDGDQYTSFNRANNARENDLELDCAGGEIIHVREVLE